MRNKLALSLGAFALVAALAGCGGTASPADGPTSTVEPSGDETIGAPPTRTTPPAPTTQAPPPQATTAPPPATGPRIEYFRVKESPSCPAGTNVAPIEGKPVTLEWKVANATSTELAVDGPGLYGAFSLLDTATIFFPCSGAPNTMQQHTYTLTTVGGGQAATQTLTVEAKVNEIPQV